MATVAATIFIGNVAAGQSEVNTRYANGHFDPLDGRIETHSVVAPVVIQQVAWAGRQRNIERLTDSSDTLEIETFNQKIAASSSIVGGRGKTVPGQAATLILEANSSRIRPGTRQAGVVGRVADASAEDCACIVYRTWFFVVARPAEIDRRSFAGTENCAFVVGRAGVAVVAGISPLGGRATTGSKDGAGVAGGAFVSICAGAPDVGGSWKADRRDPWKRRVVVTEALVAGGGRRGAA